MGIFTIRTRKDTPRYIMGPEVEMMAGSSLVAIPDETYRSPEATGATLVTKDTYGSSRGRVYVYAYQVDA